MRYVVLLLALAVGGTLEACRSADVVTTSTEIKATVVVRSIALEALLIDLPKQTDDTRLLLTLGEDLAAWKLLRAETDRFVTGSDLKAVIQSEQVAVGVAIEKIGAGQYQPAEKVALVTALRDAWASLETYYGKP